MSAILRLVAAPSELGPGLAHIERLYPGRFGDGASVRFEPGERLVISPAEDGVRIGYRSRAEAFRGLGLVMGDLITTGTARPQDQRSRFDVVAVLIDCSRNAVPTTTAALAMLARLALMGVTRVLLYMEDTYEVPGEPFFGHGRASFTAGELRTIDDAADDLGIEVVPCIQTLGHLGNVLGWPAYAHVKDTDDVLLADAEETYALLRRMIAAASEPFRSRRIHVGLDETWGLGSGAHRQRFGTQSPAEVYARHVRRVADLCRDLGLAPMMWSDMLLRFGSPANRPSDLDAVVPAAVTAALGDDVQLVYWDYNHPEVEYHVAQIERHRAIGHEPVVTGAVHTWLQKWANLPNSMRNLAGQLEAAARTGVREVIVSMWGNDGNECDYRSAMPAVQAFADFAYTGRLLSAGTEAAFAGTCDGSAGAWFAASALDLPGAEWGELASFDPTEVLPANAASWLLWSDPVLDLVPVDVAGASPARYAEIARRLEESAAGGLPGDELLRYPALLASVLSLKVDLHQRLRPALERRAPAELESIAALAAATADGVELLRAEHGRRWHESNKPTGWEILERRYAGLLSRLRTLADAVHAVRADPLSRLETLEHPQLPLRTTSGGPVRLIRHDLVARGSLTTT